MNIPDWLHEWLPRIFITLGAMLLFGAVVVIGGWQVAILLVVSIAGVGLIFAGILLSD